MNKDCKILVCDDSILARKNLTGLLKGFGYTNISEVSNGEDAVNFCKENKPELVFLDIVMPVKDGVTATGEIMAANPDTKIIGCSALLTTTMPALADTVAAINAAPWRSKVKVMVGGAPITQEFADKIGADCYTPDAASAAKAAKELVS